MLNKEKILSLKKKLSTKKIYLFGRSTSLKLFDFSIIKKDCYCLSINIFRYNNFEFDKVFVSNITKDKYNKNYIKLKDIKKIVQKKFHLKVGSIGYSLGTILFFLDQILEKKKLIYLVGFDFKFNRRSDDIIGQKRLNNNLQQQININSQKIALRYIKPYLNNIEIKKIGYDSSCSNILDKSKKINNKNKIEIVGEITTNHFGSVNRCKKLILFAKKAGVDSVKLQIRNVDTFYSKEELNKKYNSPFGKTFRDYRKALEFNDDQIQEIINYTKELQIPVFFSVLDLLSFNRILKFNPYRIKIPSTISEHTKYINYVSKNFHKEIVISTGMTNTKYLKSILRIFTKNKKLFILHCISSYPPKYEDLNFNTLIDYFNLKKNYPNIIPGYSSHETDLDGCVYAAFCGAKMIEKHIKIDSFKWSHFDFSAIDAEYELPDLVSSIRMAELSLGKIRTKKFKNEFHKYKSKNY